MSINNSRGRVAYSSRISTITPHLKCFTSRSSRRKIFYNNLLIKLGSLLLLLLFILLFKKHTKSNWLVTLLYCQAEASWFAWSAGTHLYLAFLPIFLVKCLWPIPV